jgi:hypothetical protein
MATINYLIEQNVATRSVKVEWDNLAAGDVGQSFDASGLKIASIHCWGSTGGGGVQIQGSNQISPTDFERLSNITSPTLLRDPAQNMEPAAAGWVRPYAISEPASIAILFVPI